MRGKDRRHRDDRLATLELLQKLVLLVEQDQYFADLLLERVDLVAQVLLVALARLSDGLHGLDEARAFVVSRRLVSPGARPSERGLAALLAVSAFTRRLKLVDPLQRPLVLAGMIRLRLDIVLLRFK